MKINVPLSQCSIIGTVTPAIAPSFVVSGKLYDSLYIDDTKLIIETDDGRHNHADLDTVFVSVEIPDEEIQKASNLQITTEEQELIQLLLSQAFPVWTKHNDVIEFLQFQLGETSTEITKTKEFIEKFIPSLNFLVQQDSDTIP